MWEQKQKKVRNYTGCRRLNSRKTGCFFSGGILAPALFLFLLFHAGNLHADMAGQFGLSPRGIGMANAVSAVIDDYAAVYYNPAGLALREEDDISVGYFYSHPRIHVKDPSGAERVGLGSDINAFLFGYRKNLKKLLPLKWQRNIGLGIAVELQNDLKQAALVETSLYRDTQFPVFGRVQDVLVAGAGLGIELHERVHAGIGLRIAVTLDVQDVAVAVKLLNMDFTYLNLDANIDTEARPTAGIIVRPWDPVRMAFVWRKGGPVARVDASGLGLVEIGKLSLPITFLFAFRDFYSPEEIAGSVAVQVLERLLLAVEVTHAKWSGYNLPYNEKPPGDPFRDIFIPRFGAEITLTDSWKIQAGYYYQPSPVKEDQPYTVFLDAEEHVFSCAVEFSRHLIKRLFHEPLQLRVFFQYQVLPRRSLDTANGRTAVWGSFLSLGGALQIPF